MTHQATQKAVIYCRVAASSAIQKDDGDSIYPQLTRCREYASHKNYEVGAVFKDEAVSGNFIDRPGLQAMLHYPGKHRHAHMDILHGRVNIEQHLLMLFSIDGSDFKLARRSARFRRRKFFPQKEKRCWQKPAAPSFALAFSDSRRYELPPVLFL